MTYNKEFRKEWLVRYPPPKPSMELPTGWLAPNGNYYSAPPWNHTSEGSRLAFYLYQTSESPWDHSDYQLWLNNWIHVRNNFALSMKDKTKITQKQIDTLFDWFVKFKVPNEFNKVLESISEHGF